MARKLRGTLRFLLGNLNDYSPASQAVPYESLPAIDRYMLFKLGGLMEEISAAYESFQVSHDYSVEIAAAYESFQVSHVDSSKRAI